VTEGRIRHALGRGGFLWNEERGRGGGGGGGGGVGTEASDVPMKGSIHRRRSEQWGGKTREIIKERLRAIQEKDRNLGLLKKKGFGRSAGKESETGVGSCRGEEQWGECRRSNAYLIL